MSDAGVSAGTAIVTGAGGAIGGAICARLGVAGLAVLLVNVTDRVEDVAARLRGKGVNAAACVADLTDAAAPERVGLAAERLGRPLSLLVNNAGIARDGRAGKLDAADFAAVVRVNLVAPLRLAQALGPRLADGGAVVNIASRAALGSFGQANYATSKSGLIGATRALALAWAPRLRVNAVAPGLVNTPMTAAMPPEVLRKLVNRVPLARPGAAEEIAEAVAYLGLSTASYVTGQVLLACGGRGVAG